jgi:acylphosphatase
VLVARRWLIRGKVQGVGYRDFVRREAERRTLTGWVKNLADGRVETFAQGIQEDMDSFEEILWKGSRLSDVRGIEILDATPEFSACDFEVRG